MKCLEGPDPRLSLFLCVSSVCCRNCPKHPLKTGNHATVRLVFADFSAPKWEESQRREKLSLDFQAVHV